MIGQKRNWEVNRALAGSRELRTGTLVLFEQSVGSERQNLRGFDGADEVEANRTGALPASWKTRASNQSREVHQAMWTVLDAVDSAGGNSVTRFVASHLHVTDISHPSRAIGCRAFVGSPHCSHNCSPDFKLMDTPDTQLPTLKLMNFDSESGARVAPVLFKIGIFRDVIHPLLQTEGCRLAAIWTEGKHLALTNPDNLGHAVFMCDAVETRDSGGPATPQFAVGDLFFFRMTHLLLQSTAGYQRL